jgi:hypothetical protein
MSMLLLIHERSLDCLGGSTLCAPEVSDHGAYQPCRTVSYCLR